MAVDGKKPRGKPFQKGQPNKWARHGNGAGYGGPAKHNPPSAESIQTAPEFAPGNKVGGKPGPWSQRKAELAEKAMGVWESVVDDPKETTSNKIVAADKIMNRVDGLPVQRVQEVPNAFDGMSTDELERIAAVLRSEAGGSLGEDRPGDTEAPGGEQIGRISPIH